MDPTWIEDVDTASEAIWVCTFLLRQVAETLKRERGPKHIRTILADVSAAMLTCGIMVENVNHVNGRCIDERIADILDAATTGDEEFELVLHLHADDLSVANQFRQTEKERKARRNDHAEL